MFENGSCYNRKRFEIAPLVISALYVLNIPGFIAQNKDLSPAAARHALLPDKLFHQYLKLPLAASLSASFVDYHCECS